MDFMDATNFYCHGKDFNDRLCDFSRSLNKIFLDTKLIFGIGSPSCVRKQLPTLKLRSTGLHPAKLGS